VRYAKGTIGFTGGQSLVTGVGTTWLTDEIPVGSALTIDGVVFAAHVTQVISDTSLRIARPFPGFTGGVAYQGYAYTISDDYTAYANLPYPQNGDQDAAELHNRAMAILDRVFTG